MLVVFILAMATIVALLPGTGADNSGEAVQRALHVPPVLPVNYLVKPDGTVERITDPLVFNNPEQIHTAVDRLVAAPS